jgi:hypothetical protein
VTVVELFSKIGWQLRFRHITSQREERELDALIDLIGDITLSEDRSARQHLLCKSNHKTQLIWKGRGVTEPP